MEDLYADREVQVVRFLSVSAGGTLGLGKKHFLIPMEAVTEASADRVVLSQARDTVTSAPEFNEEAEPDREYQRAVTATTAIHKALPDASRGIPQASRAVSSLRER